MTAGAALGPRTTGKPRTTPASDGQLIAHVSSRFRAFAQVGRSPGLSLARRKSPEPGPRWVRAARVAYGHRRSPTVTTVQRNRRSPSLRLCSWDDARG
jgi:hypothetical protein